MQIDFAILKNKKVCNCCGKPHHGVVQLKKGATTYNGEVVLLYFDCPCKSTLVVKPSQVFFSAVYKNRAA